MKMPFFITDLASAVTFLTRVRLPGLVMADIPAGARAAWAYPLAGAIATIAPAIALAGFVWIGASPLIAALIAMLVSIMICGGLHEDGLADAADGLFGGRDREKALSIMKDSHSGVFGVTAIVLSLLLRAAALAALVTQYGPLPAALLFVAAATAGRGCLVLQWYILPAARREGAAAAMGRPGIRTTAAAEAIALVSCVALGIAAHTLSPVLAGLAFAAVASLLFAAFVNRRIAGHTGDTLGAAAQIGEIVFLLTLVIAA
ncbi:adenosylcobinamide-GDP ribazoletransferase [Martelella soudanensis]|uniref:adenosylcobinamide-GDP ribazoletransferase n=1 Tax=unclassified Martelella TaxID=2629616 RepID=UPI0015DF8EF8|nr:MULTISPECIES: adenosylcobinamide-GDP ribazoletransferase [unclassified Martelella]